jgi:hypothetical protein
MLYDNKLIMPCHMKLIMMHKDKLIMYIKKIYLICARTSIAGRLFANCSLSILLLAAKAVDFIE